MAIRLLLGGVLAIARFASAQASPPAPERTTLMGVYSDSQAARGKNAYFTTCRSCHSPTEYTGAHYKTLWQGRTVFDAFAFIGEKMPANDPGTLANEDVVDVIAYLLNINGMPSGPQELPADPAVLKTIRMMVPGADTTRQPAGAGESAARAMAKTARHVARKAVKGRL